MPLCDSAQKLLAVLRADLWWFPVEPAAPVCGLSATLSQTQLAVGPYEFPVVAITNDHKLSCFKPYKLTCLSPGVRSLGSVLVGKAVGKDWAWRGWLLEAQERVLLSFFCSFWRPPTPHSLSSEGFPQVLAPPITSFSPDLPSHSPPRGDAHDFIWPAISFRTLSLRPLAGSHL